MSKQAKLRIVIPGGTTGPNVLVRAPELGLTALKIADPILKLLAARRLLSNPCAGDVPSGAQTGLGTIVSFVQDIAARRRSRYWNTPAQSASPYRQRNVPSGLRTAGWPVLRKHQA
jgi:hypothetical protein